MTERDRTGDRMLKPGRSVATQAAQKCTSGGSREAVSAAAGSGGTMTRAAPFGAQATMIRTGVMLPTANGRPGQVARDRVGDSDRELDRAKVQDGMAVADRMSDRVGDCRDYDRVREWDGRRADWASGWVGDSDQELD